MKQPKPMVGQTWNITKPFAGGVQTIDSIIGDEIHLANACPVSVGELHRWAKFVPQNDLEWLACNVDNWGSEYPDYNFVSRYFGWSFHKQMATNRYTRKQWQNTRYKLGLDDKPRISAKRWAERLRAKPFVEAIASQIKQGTFIVM